MTVDKLPETPELWRWSATQLALGIRTRAISSREAVTSCVERIEQVNPKINAIVELLAEEALSAADAADFAIAKGEAVGLLHGVPVATKINTDQQGHATTGGVVAFRDQIAAIDSPPIANLRSAGAVVVGRTNVPAFSLRWFSNNELHGRTLNPWDQARTPGGSSGGTSAAVASGMVPIAHGNDIAGSIRYPAYACGVMGIRPTMGRVPSWDAPVGADQSLAVQSMVAQGPLARTVDDLRLAVAAMSRFDPRDAIHAQVPLHGDALGRPIRVGVLRDVGIASLSPSGHEALDKATESLRNAGYIVEEVELALFAEAYQLWLLLVLEDLREVLPLIEQFGDEAVNMNLRYNYEVSKEMWGDCTLAKFKQGYARRGTLIAELQKFLQVYPLLLLPVSTEPPFRQDEDIESLDSNRRLVAAQWPMMSVPLLGFPAMSVPISVVEGLPTGVQILGRRYREDTLFDAAEVIAAQVSTLTPIDPKF
ncbi:amidase family protein [Alicyclobacillus sp. ALC3]|uniref:amidase family protein n=1 Tax=Alicyclobacillus sp. ALC3 TaxID=2796143 RepID=UPI002377D69F|nr:amidase family protein [Alicyclobacillus sp. ALC3]